jgi:hypothetical protein
MNQALRLSPIAHIPSVVADGQLVAFSVGSDRLVYLVIGLASLDYRVEGSGGAIFPKTVPDQRQRYRVVALSRDQLVLDVVIEQERFNIHHVQPLRNELLLVCSRSSHRAPDDIEENGRVYTRDGKFIRSVLLGDGIQSVQTTSDGVIWTSFFDEGIFGNYGWENPLGASGLVAWDSAGNRLYEFDPPIGLDTMCDCYALNVASAEDVWCYYYTEFPLVHLRDRKIEAFWEVPLKGSGAFAVSAGHALFSGGYKDRDTYHLFSLEADRQMKLVGEIELQDHEGNKLVAERTVGRGDAIHLLSGGNLYRIDIQTVLRAL